MRNWHAAAVLLAATMGARGAAAQSASLGAAPSDPAGTAPQVDVQTGANGTLDIGGARGTDVNLTGENLRGNFGASRSQPGPAVSPNLPAGRLPGYGTKPLGAPNFGPSLPGGAPPADASTVGMSSADLDASDLILPRFRRNLDGSNFRPSASRAQAEDWRYRYFGGRWWYWQPSQAWVYWNGSGWLSYAPRR